MTRNQKKHFFKVLNNYFQKKLVKQYLFVKVTKNFHFNPLNKIKWGPDERSASDFAFNSY